MDSNFTVAALKINNRKSVLKYIYQRKRATPRILQDETALSRPTIAQILKELQEEDLIFQNGLASSTGGRKAILYEFHPSLKITIGVELLIDHYEITAVDLYADTLKYEKNTLAFADEPEYYDQVCGSISRFIDSLQVDPKQILGIGIALQALISADGTKIIYGKILDCDGLDIKEFTDRLPYHCTFNHDAESNANVELWMNPMLENAIYFNIRSDLSGAIIIGRNFFQSGEYKSGVFEHMTIVPNGKPCYCGKRGCVNSYCSLSALLRDGEDIQDFFLMLRGGSAAHRKRWDKYLEYLAIAIDNLHMAINCDIILGGTLSRFLIEEDVSKLQELINQRTAFPTQRQYIYISRCSNLPLCIGAAMPIIQEYLQTIM